MATAYEQAAELARRDHISSGNELGWGCTCGAGRKWPLQSVARARAARDTHMRAVVKRIVARIERAQELRERTDPS